MDDIYQIILEHINVPYIFLCNLVTYLIIDSFLNGLGKKRKINKFWKRIISATSALFIGFVMLIIEAENENIYELIFYGFFIQFLSWDYCFKGIIKALKTKFSSGGNSKKLKEEEQEIDEVMDDN